jgi:hypothetical protein
MANLVFDSEYGKMFFSSPKNSDWLWVSHSLSYSLGILLFWAFWALSYSPGVKQQTMKLTTHLLLMVRLRTK